MIGYILNYRDFSVKDIVEVSAYSAVTDVTYSQTSTVALVRKPNIERRDYFVAYDDGFNLRLTNAAEEWLTNEAEAHLTVNPRLRPAVMGICQEVVENNGTYSLTLAQMQKLFDRTVISDDEDLREDGVEYYLANLIDRNFINSGDALTDLDYLDVHTYTATVYSFSLADNNGLVNLTTAMSTLLQKADIRVDIMPLPGKLHISIFKDSAEALKLSSTAPDVAGMTENVNVSVTSTITVKWKKSDSNGEMGAITYPKFYLLSDRTVTMDSSDPDRIDGQSTVQYIQAATIAEVRQKIEEKFGANKYDHKAELTVLKDGLYRLTDYYAGRRAILYTNGVPAESVISQINYTDSDPVIMLTLGALPVTLTDKLRDILYGDI